jgi:hypothetical protein
MLDQPKVFRLGQPIQLADAVQRLQNLRLRGVENGNPCG